MPSKATETSTDELLKRDPELLPHLRALGLNSVDEYAAWCARNGFSIRIDKRWQERCKERYFAAQRVIKEQLARRKNEKRHPRRTIQKIFSGDLGKSGLTRPHLVLIHQTAATIDDEQTRDAFQQLVVHAEGQAGLLTTQPAFSAFGTQDGNTFVEGLRGLAAQHTRWIRPLRSWQPRSHNVRRQFSSLTAHLLAKFPVPAFMDSVWFRGQSETAVQQQAWYMALAAGQSPRNLDLPIRLTKRMAHHFLNAPRSCPVEAALVWRPLRTYRSTGFCRPGGFRKTQLTAPVGGGPP